MTVAIFDKYVSALKNETNKISKFEIWIPISLSAPIPVGSLNKNVESTADGEEIAIAILQY